MLLGLISSSSAETEWQTVWSTDFSSEPSGISYSVTNGSVDISSGILYYHQGGGSGNRAINTTFDDTAFQVDTDWKLEFNWNASSANQNSSNVAFATSAGTAFTITWASYATVATVTDASDTELTAELAIAGYNKSSMDADKTITIVGDADAGIYLTINDGSSNVVDNVLVSSDFGYPVSFNGSLGRAVSHMAVDNIAFSIPYVAGFVAAPTYEISANGTARIITLSSLTDGATFKWSATEPADGEDYSAWTATDATVETSDTIIYAVATDGTNYSDVTTIATGAGTAVTLATPTISLGDYADGATTVTLSSDNSSVVGTPTAQIVYEIDGVTTTIDNGGTASIADGVTFTFYAIADGYENSESVTMTAVAPNSNPEVISETYSGIVDDSYSLATGDATDVDEYSYITYNDGTSTSTVSENLVISSSVSWVTTDLMRPNGFYLGAGKTLAIINLQAGDYVTLNGVYGNGNFSISSVSNGTIDEWNSREYSKYCIEVTADGTLTFSMGRYGYLQSITVQRAESTATAISKVETSENAASTACYNLAGQRVSSSAKGIVIMNGKKYVK